MTVSILLVDDHVVFRQLVRKLLETIGEFRIIGEASDGIEALVMAKQLHPDVAVLDWIMPRLGGSDVIHELRKLIPGTKVIILSMRNDEAYVLNALECGASGYIVKEDAVYHLAEGVRMVVDGYEYFSPSLRKLVAQYKVNSAAVKPVKKESMKKKY